MARPAKKPLPAKGAKRASAAAPPKQAAPDPAKSAAPDPAKSAAPAPPKPKASPKAEPAAPKPPRRRPGIPPNELIAVRRGLQDQAALLERELADLQAGTFNASQSDLSGEVSFDEESADAGTFTFERERDLSLGNNIRDLREKVESALRRIDQGTYGICERCERPIDKARLKALPYSVLCINCKKLEERIH